MDTVKVTSHICCLLYFNIQKMTVVVKKLLPTVNKLCIVFYVNFLYVTVLKTLLTNDSYSYNVVRNQNKCRRLRVFREYIIGITRFRVHNSHALVHVNVRICKRLNV